MIPADVASRLQVSADTTLRPVAPTQEISDKLSGLSAGQRVMAEIQAMLPNGTYRAVINQRNITLALPFSAKSGDSLELMVTENDGKLALAVLSRQGAEGKAGEAASTSTSASTTLSRTGQLIGELFANTRGAKDGTNAVPLNASRPILSAPPGSAAELAPLLKQAIAQSGMFYEAHQVEWFAGRFAKADLLQEPQGKLSDAATLAEAQLKGAMQTGSNPAAAARQPHSPEEAKFLLSQTSATAEAALAQPAETNAARPAPELRHYHEMAGNSPAASAASAESGRAATAQTSAAQLIAPQLQHLVQQQLESLATQNFIWQGQVWPGQEMSWEIDEDASSQNPGEEDVPAWSTRLRLHLPNLGEIDTRIRLHGNQLALTMNAANEETRELMRTSGQTLSQNLENAGLNLATLGVDAIQEILTEGGSNEPA